MDNLHAIEQASRAVLEAVHAVATVVESQHQEPKGNPDHSAPGKGRITWFPRPYSAPDCARGEGKRAVISRLGFGAADTPRHHRGHSAPRRT